MTPIPTLARFRRLLAAALALALVAAACGGEDGDDGVVASDDGGAVSNEPISDEPADDPFGIDEWILTSAEVDGTSLTLLDSHPVTLRVDDAGGVGGTAACNSYFGTLVDGEFLFDGFGVTEMACDPPEAMDLEFAFLGALGRTATAERSGNALTLTGDGIELRFALVPPTPDAELTGTTWLLDTLIDDSAASSILAGTAPELRLDDELALFDGCNTIAGGYEIDGDTLRTGALRSTLRGCEAGVAEQAARISAVIGAQPTISIEGNRLTLTGTDGLALSFLAG